MNQGPGLRAALIVLVLIAIAPAFAVVAVASANEQRARMARAEADLHANVELGAVQHQHLIDNARQLLSAVAHAPDLRLEHLAECTAYLQALQADLPPAAGVLGIIDAEGRHTCRSEPTGAVAHSADRPFFRAALRDRRFTVGEFTVSRLSGRRVLTFGQPIVRRDGSVRGVAYFAANLLQSAELLRQTAGRPETTLAVLDFDGVVLAAAGSRAPAVGAPLPAGWLREAIAQSRSGPATALDAQGREQLVAVRPVGRPGERGLTVAGFASHADVLAPGQQRLRAQFAALALITLAAAALAWGFAERVVLQPMRRLLRDVDALAREEQRLDRPRAPVRLLEIGELHRRFHEMARRLMERAVQRDGAVAEMAHQKELFESVLEGMAEGVQVLDERGRTLLANTSARRILPGLPAPGMRLAEALGPPEAWGLYDLDGVTPLPRERLPSLLELGVDQFRMIVRGPLSGGAEKALQGSARPMALPGREPGGGILVFSDFTDAWAAERALRDSEARYRTLFESNPHPMWVFDVETLRFLTVNDAAVAHYGYGRDEFLAMTLEDIRPAEDTTPLHERLRRMDDVLSAPTPWRHRLKDGRIIRAEVTSHELTYAGRPARMVLASDVTQRLEAEEALRQLNETLEKRVRDRTRDLEGANRELESFSYSVSHDLRAPLQAIDGFSRALQDRHAGELDARGNHFLERIRDNAARMESLIDALLTLARVTTGGLNVETVDLARIARQILERLRQAEPDRRVEADVAPSLPCKGDARLLAAVLENLIGNAWKFTAQRDPARIAVRRVPGDGPPTWFVSDNGAGFDMAYADKLFHPFRRLHDAHEFQGTGIGLATVHRIITRHGGRIWAESAPDQGCTFYFTLLE